MGWIRRWLILLHRYLGIALSLVFVMWFVSGIAMIYAKDMPGLTPGERLARLPPIDFSRIAFDAADAAERADVGTRDRALLLTILNRPAYRFGTARPVTVFADTGERMPVLASADSARIASAFLDLPRAALHFDGVLEAPDQWTLLVRNRLPLHKFTADDGDNTHVYVSPQLGEVVVFTTRASRVLAWVSAIPHWLYLAPLRVHATLWRFIVIALSALGTIAALLGLVLAVVQFAPSRPIQVSRLASYVPYAGLWRWHYLFGIAFGGFTLTWVLSGMLSMEPLFWAAGGGTGDDIPAALAGGPLNLDRFPRADASGWTRLRPAGIKEVQFASIQGDPYYLVAQSEEQPLVVRADSLEPRRQAFSIDSLLSRVRAAHPDVPIVESSLLSDYDSYYYAQDRDAPLPVLRIKFDDPWATWVYLDPATSRLVARVTRRRRVERWIYHGFHSLDFSFWYYSRPLWDAGMIVLALGGCTLSGIGGVLGYRRLRRTLGRPEVGCRGTR